MHIVQNGTGWLEVVCGPMFSGKSEELIRRVKRAQIARQKVQVFKPKIDARYHESRVVSHSQHSVDAIAVASSDELRKAIEPDTKVLGIDEVQFFDAGIVQTVEDLAKRGVRVIMAGLDQDFAGKPFEPVPTLMAIAEYVTKTLAICTRCGAPAGRSQRLSHDGDKPNGERVLVGAADAYEPRCRSCHSPRPERVSATLNFDQQL